MNCSKCNNSINEGQEVCLNCGHILGYESESSKKCIHCNRNIPLEYKKCPYCKRKQKRKRYLLKFIVIMIIMLINTYLLTLLYSSEVTEIKKSYKEDCKVVTVKELIEDNKELDETLVTFEASVKDVVKVSSIFNRVLITADVNNQTIYIYFNNKESIGYLKNDIIKVYGKYKELSGNKPVIHAKYVIKNRDK